MSDFCRPDRHAWKVVFYGGRLITVCRNCPTIRDKSQEDRGAALKRRQEELRRRR